MRGEPLAVGDRITWSEYFIPGPHYCSEVLDLPQKSPGVDKYGHMAAATPPHHHGGFGEYCYILPQSWILRLPDGLSDAEAAPINCGVATMIAVTEAAEIRIGQTRGDPGPRVAGPVRRGDRQGARRRAGDRRRRCRRAACTQHELRRRPGTRPDGHRSRRTGEPHRGTCQPLGADAVVEVCGDPGVIPSGIAMLRVGGRYVLGGVVNPGAMVTLDANLLLRKMLTLRGVHNYHPRHLVEALDFVVAQRRRFPFSELGRRHLPAGPFATASTPRWPMVNCTVAASAACCA
jgi:threonine dehydrogenase-like Zn-dependent dehydrogenase